jgi:hypothetical protein
MAESVTRRLGHERLTLARDKAQASQRTPTTCRKTRAQAAITTSRGRSAEAKGADEPAELGRDGVDRVHASRACSTLHCSA